MKLSKSQIKYIDDFLQKNELKFWDVRMEVLDHMVLSIEEAMQHQQLSFEEALLNAHEAFGNKTTMPWTSVRNIERDNSGYRKLLRQRQKELARENRRLYKIAFKKLIVNPRFWAFYLICVILLSCLWFLPKKTGLIVMLMMFVIPFLIQLPFWFKRPYPWKSLRLQMSGNFFSLGIAISGFMPILMDKVEKDTLFNIIFCLVLIEIPLFIIGYKHFRKVYKEEFAKRKLLLG